MIGQIRERPSARRDLVRIYVRFAREAGDRVAERFTIEAEAAFRRLASMPGLGTRYEAADPTLGELRYFPMPSRFRNYLVFYRPLPDGIEVVRVLHGARDIAGILAEDNEIEDE